MKRLFFLLLILTGLLLGCGAVEVREVYTVERDGTVFTVDPAAHTITEGGNVYIYKVTANSTTITYPDGRYFTWTYNEHGATGVGSTLSNGDISNQTLVSIAEEAQPRNPSGKSASAVVSSLIVAVFGLIAAVAPNAFWYLSRGWAYKNAEPSDAFLIFSRIVGCILLIFSVFMFILLK